MGDANHAMAVLCETLKRERSFIEDHPYGAIRVPVWATPDREFPPHATCAGSPACGPDEVWKFGYRYTKRTDHGLNNKSTETALCISPYRGRLGHFAVHRHGAIPEAHESLPIRREGRFDRSEALVRTACATRLPKFEPRCQSAPGRERPVTQSRITLGSPYAHRDATAETKSAVTLRMKPFCEHGVDAPFRSTLTHKRVRSDPSFPNESFEAHMSGIRLSNGSTIFGQWG